jgi:hypothetical protein
VEKKKTSGKHKSKMSSNDDDATTMTTNDKRRGKREKENADDMMTMIIMPLGEHEDLIVPFIMDFLDVPTLVSLGSTNKKNQEHLSEQVARRKSRFKAIQNKINEHLSAGNILMPSREKVHQALRLRQEACRLIDSGLGRVDNDLFAEERGLLEAHRSCDTPLMLPTAFYLSKNRIWEKPATAGTPPYEELITRVRNVPLLYLVAVEHLHMPGRPFFEDDMFPLRIYTHPNADGFTYLVKKYIKQIVSTGQLEAFRIAARRFVKERPHTLPYLLLTLVLAERLTPHVLVDRNSVFIANGGVDVLASTLTLSDCEQDLWWSDAEQN